MLYSKEIRNGERVSEKRKKGREGESKEDLVRDEGEGGKDNIGDRGERIRIYHVLEA